MKHHKSPFKRRHFEPTLILLCVNRVEADTRAAEAERLAAERGRGWYDFGR